MPKQKNAVNVFYSWQSDSPRKTNLNAIRKALANACKRLEAANPNLKLVPDEATRDTSGAPKIYDKIVEKIDAASIFLPSCCTPQSKRCSTRIRNGRPSSRASRAKRSSMITTSKICAG